MKPRDVGGQLKEPKSNRQRLETTKQEMEILQTAGHILYWTVMTVGLGLMLYGLYLMLFEDIVE